MISENKNWFRRHWILSIILIFIIIGLIGAILNSESPPDEKSKKQETTIYNIGETFMVDDVSFKVNKISEKEIIGEYIMGTLFGEEAKGIFYIIDLTLENKASESKDIFMENFKIIDEQNRKFDYNTMAEIYYDENGKDAITFGQQLQPGLPISGVKIFDLPTTAKGLKLEITCCGFMSEKAQVNLGI